MPKDAILFILVYCTKIILDHLPAFPLLAKITVNFQILCQLRVGPLGGCAAIG